MAHIPVKMIKKSQTTRSTNAGINPATLTFISAWGIRYRTKNSPTQWEAAYAIPSDSMGGRQWSLPVLWATKIGEVPYDSQYNHTTQPDGFLCQISSIQPSSETDWPWVNIQTPATLGFEENGTNNDLNSLFIGDLGEISFYLKNDGSISVESACG